jgi:hypothetical protein
LKEKQNKKAFVLKPDIETQNSAAIEEIDDMDVDLYSHRSAYVSRQSDTEDWIIDSGCTQHVSGNEEIFDYMAKILPIKINGISGFVNATHVGTIHIDRPDIFPNNRKFKLDDVLYVPGLKLNLISVKQLTGKGYEISFKNGICSVKPKNGKPFIIKMNEEQVFALNAQQTKVNKNFTAEDEALLWDMHRRLGHPGSTRLLKVIRELNILETKNNFEILVFIY